MTRTVLITGGAGTLGQAVTPMLLADGWNVRLGDIRRPPGSGAEWIELDLRQPEQVRSAVAGTDAVLHAAAWHGIHLRDHPPRDFWELNVNGTFNVLEALVQAGVGAVVLSSTMGVYGESSRPDEEEPAIRVHEGLPLRPGDIYGHSKVVAERLVAFFSRTHDIRGVALRYGMFVPEPFAHSAVRMLYGGVDARDVAAANLAALRRLEAPAPFAAYNVFSALRFADDDLDALRTDPVKVVARHWPDAPKLLTAAGAKLWGPINTIYDIGRARHELGWQPRYNFDQFLDGIRQGVRSEDALVAAEDPAPP
jgi:UDP-glucose 4-epimerase